MTKPKIVEGPSTRICRTKDCQGVCSGRRQFCDDCRKIRYTATLRSLGSNTQAYKTCSTCGAEHDREEFIVSVDKNVAGYACTRYGPDCDDCRFTKDWSLGTTSPDVSGQPPYEAAKRLLAYEYRVLPSKWINRRTALTDLHHLVMCKLGKIRLEGIDLRIADARDVIARYGPV